MISVLMLDLSIGKLKNLKKSSKIKIDKTANINNIINAKNTLLEKIILITKMNSKVYELKIYKKQLQI